MNAYDKIKKAIKEVAGEDSSFALSVPEDKAHGDIATNAAFSAYAFFSQRVGVHADEGVAWDRYGSHPRNPKELADIFVLVLREKLATDNIHVEAAGPGFINFFLKPETVRTEAKNVGKITTKFTGKKVLVEHSSPNLFKPFSIGHLMNNIEGEFVSRAIRQGGGYVKTLSFPSDVSLGIAKALMVLERDIQGKDINSFFSEKIETESVKYLGESYARGVKECEESESSLEKAKEILDKLYNLKDDKFYDLVVLTKDINERYFKRTLKDIDSEIDGFIYERDAGNEGMKIITAHTGKDKTFQKSEGAVIYTPKEERKDINTSVFINSQGYPTYEAKDLGLLLIKQRYLARAGILNFSPEASFFVTDAEQIPHFKVVFAAASELNLGSDWSNLLKNSHHIPHGRMLFKGQKMSSRLGGVPLALDVIGVIEEEVRERAGDKIAKYSQEEKDKLTRDIALSALRIAVLRSKPGLNINFDPEMSLSFEGDSGPYLLYTHARCASLLEKGVGITPTFDANALLSPLERTLLHFNETLKESIEDIAPQKLVTYLFKVAQELNSFYGREQIIGDDAAKTAHNLAAISWTKEVLKQGLFVLGISAIERM